MCPVGISAPALSPDDQEPPALTACMLYTGRCDEYTSNSYLQPLLVCSLMHSGSSPDYKYTLLRQSTFCDTSLMTSAPSVYGHCAEPPLTPARQIIRTPLYSSRIEYHGLRTPSRGNRTSAGVDIDFEHQTFKADFLDTPHNTCLTHKVFAPQYRLWARRLSYPHFRIMSSSYAHSPPNLATGFNGC